MIVKCAYTYILFLEALGPPTVAQVEPKFLGAMVLARTTCTFLLLNHLLEIVKANRKLWILFNYLTIIPIFLVTCVDLDYSLILKCDAEWIYGSNLRSSTLVTC